MRATLTVGLYFIRKYRLRAAEVGAGAVARQLRKQGVDLPTALLLIFGIEERT